jgi:hypothetical protein
MPLNYSPKAEVEFDTELARFTPRQMEAIDLLDSGIIKFLLYGGALGGGKSYFLRWYSVRRLIDLAGQGVDRPVSMLACEDYPALKDRQLSKIPREFPPEMGAMHSDHKEYGRCYILAPYLGGGVICFRNLDDPSKYQSAEFCLIAVDELTKNPFETFTHLRSRLRWPGLTDRQCQFIGATNPGGVGHGWVKAFWMDHDFPPEWIAPTDYRPMFAYVPSKATDNPHLDPNYWAMLQTLPEQLRRAFAEGDWQIFVGQAFPEITRKHHGIRPLWPVPEGKPLYMTMDWGFGKPFSIGWWWVDNDGRVIRCAEWYGWNGTADQGMRLSDSEIADGIIEREDRWKLNGRGIIRLAGPDCFQKRPDYRGGGQGPSTAEVFAEKGIYLVTGDPNRQLKIRAFRERIRVPDIGRPMMAAYDTCDHFFRTLPNLIMDKNNPEDIDTATEDHLYDECCHIAMARPITPLAAQKPKSQAEKDFEVIYGTAHHDNDERYS